MEADRFGMQTLNKFLMEGNRLRTFSGKAKTISYQAFYKAIQKIFNLENKQ